MSDLEAKQAPWLPEADPVARKILGLIRRSPGGVLRSAVLERVKDAQTEVVLTKLVNAGFVSSEPETTFPLDSRTRTRTRFEDQSLTLSTPPVQTPEHEKQPTEASGGERLRTLWREHSKLRRIARQSDRRATNVLGQIRALNLQDGGE